MSINVLARVRLATVVGVLIIVNSTFSVDQVLSAHLV